MEATNFSLLFLYPRQIGPSFKSTKEYWGRGCWLFWLSSVNAWNKSLWSRICRWGKFFRAICKPFFVTFGHWMWSSRRDLHCPHCVRIFSSSVSTAAPLTDVFLNSFRRDSTARLCSSNLLYSTSVAPPHSALMPASVTLQLRISKHLFLTQSYIIVLEWKQNLNVIITLNPDSGLQEFSYRCHQMLLHIQSHTTLVNDWRREEFYWKTF